MPVDKRVIKKTLQKHKPLLMVAFGSAILFIVVFTLYTIFRGLDEGLYFRGYAADGSFQTYNPLRRLEAGQVIGRDFQFFHGIGIPLALFLPFKLLGANLFAAEFTRWVVCGVAFLLTVFIFYFALLRSWKRSIFATALATALVVAFTNMIQPTNSLLALRTATPLLVAALIAMPIQKTIRLRGHSLNVVHIIMPIVLGVSFFFSTEHGIYTIFAYFVLQAGIALLYRRKHLLRAGLVLGGEFIIMSISILAIFTLATAGHPQNPLVYALRTIPNEQFWYFGVPPNEYLRPATIGSIIWHFGWAYFLLLATAGTVVVSARQRLISPLHIKTYTFLMLYAVASLGSLLGYTSVSQAFPFVKIIAVIFVALAVPLYFYITESKRKKPRIVSWEKYAAHGALIIFSVSMLGGSFYSLYRIQAMEVRNIVHDTIPAINQKHDSWFGAKTHWALKIGAFPELSNVRQGELWSTYTSYYDSNAGVLNPSHGGFDYMIHAIGPENFNGYVTDFVKTKPRYVLTTRPSYLWYEQWLWTSDWPFYREVLAHYKIIKTNESHYLWERQSSTEPDNATHNASIRNNTFALPASKNDMTLYEVTVSYKPTTPLRIFHKVPRYLLKPQDTALLYPISVPSDATTQSFIVPVSKKSAAPTLHAYASGLIPGAQLTLENVSYRTITTDAANMQPFKDNAELCSWTPGGLNTLYVPCNKVKDQDKAKSTLGILAPCGKGFDCTKRY